MRILVLNWQDRLNPQGGGAEAHLHETFGRIASAGHEVDLLCSGFAGAPPADRLDGIQVYRVGGRHTFALRAIPAARRLLRRHRYDVVVEDLNKIPLFSPVWSPVPVLLLVHHLFGRTAFQEASLPIAATTWLLERGIPRSFRGIPTVAVSQSTAEDLRRRGLEGPAIEVIPNGIDPEAYRLDDPPPRTEIPTVLYLGRLKRYKGIEIGIRAMALLAERGVDCRFRIAGTGDHGPALESLTRELGLDDRIDFLGFVEDEEKVRLFHESWVHLLTSPKEGWGITTLEAGICGTPTVASDSPGLRDAVRDGETGLLVEHGEVAEVADALVRLFDPAERDRFGAAARSFAERFSWDRSAERMEGVLERVARDSGTL